MASGLLARLAALKTPIERKKLVAEDASAHLWSSDPWIKGRRLRRDEMV